MHETQAITVRATVDAPVERVWTLWTEPGHIKQWNTASTEWHTTAAENDLRAGGKFSSRMEAKDGSIGFDFSGVYEAVDPVERIAYVLGDGRKVEVTFSGDGRKTEVVETFDPENENPREMQQAGWQAILDNFKRYAEAQA